jgi:hypothetical protein
MVIIMTALIILPELPNNLWQSAGDRGKRAASRRCKM